ncbi:MAG: hypothetical protein IJQ70_02310 [Synergistaceae bacterium]|nr:hypothetical protein [Synergistaceae bacterium]
MSWFHEHLHAPIVHDERASFWENLHDIIHDLRNQIDDADYCIFNRPFEKPDKDALNLHALAEAVAALDDAVAAHSKELRDEADYREDRRVYHQENVYAWSLGLKPSVLREQGIKDFSRGIFSDDPSPWKEIAAFKQHNGISAEDTSQAVIAWREQLRKAG